MSLKIPSDYIKTGVLGRTYKTDGLLYLYTINSKENFLKSKEVLIKKKKSSSLINLEIAEVLKGLNEKFLFIKFFSYDTKELASSLSGSDVFILRRFANVLKDGEIYIQDLVSLKIKLKDSIVLKTYLNKFPMDSFSVDSDGFRTVAEVKDVVEGTQSLLLFCRMLSPNKDGKILNFYIPYMKVYLNEADLNSRTIELLEFNLLP